jgi:hypothetical protein
VCSSMHGHPLHERRTRTHLLSLMSCTTFPQPWPGHFPFSSGVSSAELQETRRSSSAGHQAEEHMLRHLSHMSFDFAVCLRHSVA